MKTYFSDFLNLDSKLEVIQDSSYISIEAMVIISWSVLIYCWYAVSQKYAGSMGLIPTVIYW